MKQFSKDLGNVSLSPKGKWSRKQEYERLALVYNSCDNLSYVAKIDVPSGVDIENREYWQPMNATGYADNNFINLTTENENGTITAYESLEEAVATILPINRRAGATLSFYNLNSDRLDRQAEFELWQFNSTDLANWENKDYWNNVYYNWNVFVGWYVGADALKNHVKLPTVGQYAYVGSNPNDAVLYQCRTNGTWTNTGTKVRNYMSVVVSGNMTIGDDGNWLSDGKDTGILATSAVDEQLDNIGLQLQQHATEIDKLQKQDVTLKSNIDSNFETINNKVDEIKTATDSKIDTADANLQKQITGNDNDIATLNTKHESLSKTVQGIAATGGASTATNVTYDKTNSGLNAENAQDAIDKLANSENIKYNNKISKLEAGNVQTAIDEVGSKVSNLSISANNISIIDDSYFDLSNFTEAENVETNIGVYGFGQGLNDTPLHPTASFTKKFSKSIEGADSTGVYLYLKDCHVANKDYRTYAVYDKDGKLVREGVSTTNVVLYIERSFTVLAFCEGIYIAGSETQFDSINEKILEIERSIKNANSLLNGKTFWTIFDSLGQNTWQNHFTEISGAIFHEDLNLKADKPISWGGSDSTPSSDDATQQRALNLISYKDSYPIDYVFIENINDRGNKNFGTIEDKPFMRSQRIIYSSGKEFVDYSSASTYLESNKSEIVKTIQNRKVGTIISIPYQGGSAIRGSKVKFLTRPALEGDISINVNGHNYSVHVNAAMTIQNIVDEFVKYSYGPGWTDVDNGDGSISIFFYTETSFNITFDGGDTGVTANVEDTFGGGYVHTYYLGEDIDDTNWNDVNNWGNGVTLFSIYKGLIEYLQKEIPQAKLYWVAPFSIGVDFSANTYKKSDGSWSQDKYRQSELYKSNRKLYEVQKAVCEYYDILFLDLDSKSGMSIINIENYFNTNNVHPKKVGYDRYAEAILNLM